MKKRNLLASLLALSLTLALFSGCAKTPNAKKGALTVTDMTGREIKLGGPAEKIVALTAANVEILYAVGAGDTLVGRGEFCDYPAEALAVMEVQSGSNTNVEQIIALEPQVVIMATMAQSEEQIAALEKAGIAVVAIDAPDIAGTYTAIELIGAITGKNDAAAAVIDDMKAVFADIKAKSENTGKTIYFEVSPLEYGLWTAGAGTFMDEIAAMVGLTNVFSDVTSWGEISEEQVIERDPDYILTSTMYFGEGLLPVDEILGRAAWQGMKAIQNGYVINANSDELTRPGPRLANAARYLYDFVSGVS
ncbi:MAG: ABC transporter substrate-binding protein [Oscillospiraceae bacterium]|jgi:iron complex transport system substrate-binding protein|nr:ABC transporter substrate-binding protein [Oscillospiraceae bacterium]